VRIHLGAGTVEHTEASAEEITAALHALAAPGPGF
jgi:hypothetical protein